MHFISVVLCMPPPLIKRWSGGIKQSGCPLRTCVRESTRVRFSTFISWMHGRIFETHHNYSIPGPHDTCIFKVIDCKVGTRRSIWWVLTRLVLALMGAHSGWYWLWLKSTSVNLLAVNSQV